MPKLTPPAGLNLILGDSAGGIFNRNFGRSQLLVERDVLNCGPTPRCADWKSWSQMRADFWREIGPPGIDEWASAYSNVANDAERLQAASCINIWAATDVPEQLFIAFVVNLAAELGIPADRLRLVQFERTRSGGQLIGSMGELNEENMAAFPDPAPLSADMIENYLSAWEALISPDPNTIARFSDSRANASRWLKIAMQLTLRRFPEMASGLPFWDRVLLEKVNERGPSIARVIGYLIGDVSGDPDKLGDWYLFHRLHRLADARLPRPLVTFSGEMPLSFRSNAELTPFGLDVIEGRASAYPAIPIDEYAAGVKLTSNDGSVWFNDGGCLVRGER